ncbi:MAG: ferredoxin [Thermoprotei archaeon]|nr:MAG: ferredoxin [Thermoprotei archaeon]
MHISLYVHIYYLRQSALVEVIIDHNKCDVCGLCITYCPTRVFYKVGDLVFADSNNCIECYGCIPLCPHGAISISSKDS